MTNSFFKIKPENSDLKAVVIPQLKVYRWIA